MIVSLVASLLFFQNPNDEAIPDCNETCTQLNETEPVICVTECAEPMEAGLWVAMLSMVMTIPVSIIVNISFKWLRSPITTAVESETTSVKSLIKSARDAQKRVFGASTDAAAKLEAMAQQAQHLKEIEGVDWDTPGTEVVLTLYRYRKDAPTDGSESTDCEGDDLQVSENMQEMLKMNGGAGVDEYLGRSRFGLPIDLGLSKKHLRLFFRTDTSLTESTVEDLGWAAQSLSKKSRSTVVRKGDAERQSSIAVPLAPEFCVLCDGDTLVRTGELSDCLTPRILTCCWPLRTCLLQRLHLNKRDGKMCQVAVKITKHVNPFEQARLEAAAAEKAVVAAAREQRLKKDRAVRKEMIKMGLLEQPTPAWKRLGAGRRDAAGVAVSQVVAVDDGAEATDTPGLSLNVESKGHEDLEDKGTYAMHDGGSIHIPELVELSDESEIRRPTEAATSREPAEQLVDQPVTGRLGDGADDARYSGAGDEETGSTRIDTATEPTPTVKGGGQNGGVAAWKRRASTKISVSQVSVNDGRADGVDVRSDGDGEDDQVSYFSPPRSENETSKRLSFKQAGEKIRTHNRVQLALGPQDEEAPTIPAVPRPMSASTMPVAVAFAIGLFGIFMIYGLAAGLGPENTKVWLIAAASSFVTKVFCTQPLRVLASAVFLKLADSFHSTTMRQIAKLLQEGEAGGH
jgi:hypothetical protein